MSELALHGRIAMITGAGSGLGAAFARRLAADGARIVVNASYCTGEVWSASGGYG